MLTRAIKDLFFFILALFAGCFLSTATSDPQSYVNRFYNHYHDLKFIVLSKYFIHISTGVPLLFFFQSVY